ncbi:MAG: D-glycerate dehydrogenase [Alphaproteobacteria bacterium]|nr:D-glycerate dehydrogenase [Alphaproteobacteria bacterium]
MPRKDLTEKPVILVTRRVPPPVEARIRDAYRATLNDDDRVWNAGELIDRARGCTGLLICPTERLTTDVIERLPAEVKICATFSVGYDHIDIATAKRRGLIVTNTPDVLTDATADIAILLILGAARRATEAEALLRRGDWGAWSTMFMLGTHVSGKRLGIYGMGRIGRAVARRARGFGMTIHYCNRQRLSAELETGAIFHATPEALLPHCDFLSLHCPASAETHHFLDARRIALLPDGAVVVNTARGTVVDDGALIAALKSGKLAAAGLDVFEGEPRFNRTYLELSNTMLLPHIGSATHETRAAMGNRAVDNLDAYFAGRAPADRVI